MRLYLSFLVLLHAEILKSDSTSAVIQRMVNAVSGENLSSQVRSLQEAGGHYSRVCYTVGNDSAVQYIYRSMKHMAGFSSVELDSFLLPDALPPFHLKTLSNVVAIRKGVHDTTNVVVVGAHLDSFAGKMPNWSTGWQTIHAPGADDNASGVAAVLEIARIISDTSFHFSNGRSIYFIAFEAEETSPVYPWSLNGSIYCARKLKSEGKNVAAMINLDMIGYNTISDCVDIVSDTNSQWLGIQCKSMNTAFALGLTMNQPPFVYATYSDHSSFWREGYPAILLIEHAPPTEGNSSYAVNTLYHTTGDTVEALNPALMKKISQLALATMATVASPSATLVERQADLVPSATALSQNFPNPFNPTTAISYQVPARSGVEGSAVSRLSLKVYDVLGREVATLVDEEKPAGTYRATWDATGMPSGVYFYKLTVGEFVQTMKMVVMK